MRVLLVDDHALFRAGFKMLVTRHLGSGTEIREAASASAGLHDHADYAPDLIFLDLGLPDVSGLDGLKAFQQKLPTAAIVIVSAVLGEDTIAETLEMGAVGYLPKSIDADEIEHALKQILAGQVFAPQLPDQAAANARDLRLTRRQLDVLGHLCSGLSNKQIARHLKMSDNTVRVHVHSILRTMDVDSRTAAAVKAKARGLF